jgi:hypothetical protein
MRNGDRVPTKLPRAAAPALALAAWYLMLPPRGGDQKADYRAPISAWSIAGAYATAADCQIAQDEYTTVAIRDCNNHPAKGGICSGLLLDGVLRADASACISTDDPRLKGN